MISGMNDSRRNSASRLPWRLASERRATHWVAVANCTRCPARQARIETAIARRLLCLSMAVADGAGAWWALRVAGVWAGGLEDAEEAAGEVALEAALDLAWGLALGEAAGGVGAGGGVVLEAAEHDRVE